MGRSKKKWKLKSRTSVIIFVVRLYNGLPHLYFFIWFDLIDSDTRFPGCDRGNPVLSLGREKTEPKSGLHKNLI